MTAALYRLLTPPPPLLAHPLQKSFVSVLLAIVGSLRENDGRDHPVEREVAREDLRGSGGPGGVSKVVVRVCVGGRSLLNPTWMRTEPTKI